MRVLLIVFLLAETLSAQSATQARTAINRALPILQRSAGEFVAKRACVSCHHNILPILMLHMAKDRGFTINDKTLGAIETKTFRELRSPNAFDDAVQGATLNDPTPNDSYLLMAAHAAKLPPDAITAIYAQRLIGWQRESHWTTSDFRPPHSSSLFTTTATAVRAISLYSAEGAAAMRSAKQWMIATMPASTEDAAFRLMGLVWAGASSDEIAAAQRDLLAMQKAAGGWPEIPGYEPDAYSTGESLFALRESGMPASNADWSKGAKFLISTQARDGTWRVHTRMVSPAEVSPPYFEAGFPYKEDQFLSYAGTAWAAMALLSSLPEQGREKGTASEFPLQNSEAVPFSLPALPTVNGTTPLMLAANDPAKVRALLALNVDVKARSSSGFDALTVATSYRGTTESVRLLLDAGAEPDPPEGVRVRRTPMITAAMAGDVDNVKLLLAHGAEPSVDALSQAITFGNVDVVSVLIAAGADVNLIDGSGINLLHWAAITNRPKIIPLLAEAGVDIDAVDQWGFTPLMYSASIDFGNTDALQALLAAGANRNFKNDQGRTAIDMARKYKHANLEAALR